MDRRAVAQRIFYARRRMRCEQLIAAESRMSRRRNIIGILAHNARDIVKIEHIDIGLCEQIHEHNAL